MGDNLFISKREFYPTVKDLKDMGLSEWQINKLLEYQARNHGFRDRLFIRGTGFNPPHSIFFLDIKGTIYHAQGHGSGSAILGRTYDSYPIFIQDILALGGLFDRVNGERFTMDQYELSEDHRIVYRFPTDISGHYCPYDIPKYHEIIRSGIPSQFDCSLEGPYYIVFISNDSVESQRNIILFLLTIYKLFFARSDSIYFHIPAPYMCFQDIVKLEKLFDDVQKNYDSFVEYLPPEYQFLRQHDIEEIKKKVNSATFLSVHETGKTKEELMLGYISKFNTVNGITSAEYNIFACGDSNDDWPMIEQAFKLGGLGMLNTIKIIEYTTNSEVLRRELYENCDILTRGPLTSNGFSDFYNHVIERMVLERTWDIAEEMQAVNNNPDGGKILTMQRTNHYLWSERRKS